MPLSEEEQRLLEQMERALVAEDPKFASTLRGSSLRAQSRRRALLSAIGFVVGVVLLMAGAILAQTVVSVIGFVVMLVAAYGTIIYWRRMSSPDLVVVRNSGATSGSRSKASRRPSRPRSSGTFMERMEERWRRRRQSGF